MQTAPEAEMAKALLADRSDNVATGLERLARGQRVRLRAGDDELELTVAEDIDFGHKFAVRPIAAGEAVRKYAETIGRATCDIAPGQWVHVHNVESVRARGDRAGAAR
jgi:altronate dehydratase small subunit